MNFLSDHSGTYNMMSIRFFNVDYQTMMKNIIDRGWDKQVSLDQLTKEENKDYKAYYTLK